jgi:hypothetical protein
MKSNLLLKFIIAFVLMIILRLLRSPAIKHVLTMGRPAIFALTALYALGAAYMIMITFKVLVGYFTSPDG